MSIYVQSPYYNDGRHGHYRPVFTALTIAATAVLYLWTRHPLLAALLPWLHGGWATFSTGLWIVRVDPLRRRAWTCFSFYLAVACWKAAATALASIVLLALLAARFGVQPNENEIIASLLTLVAGLVLNSLIALVAVVAALCCRVRVCVRANLRTTTLNDLSRAAEIGPSSRTPFSLEFIVVATAMILPLIIFGIMLLMICLGNGNAAVPPKGFTVVFAIATMFGVPLSAVPIVGWLCSRVVAKSPQDCWPAGTC